MLLAVGIGRTALLYKTHSLLGVAVGRTRLKQQRHIKECLVLSHPHTLDAERVGVHLLYLLRLADADDGHRCNATSLDRCAAVEWLVVVE